MSEPGDIVVGNPDDGLTRIESSDRGDLPTRREESDGGRHARRLVLPADVTDRYDYVRDLRVTGGEADLAIVRDRASGEEFILKSYRAGLSPDPLAMEALRSADSHHVVRVIEFHDGDDGAWEIQEFCPLGSLSDWVNARGSRLEPTDLTVVVRNIMDALRFLHTLGSGIAHRDLKPANVLVRSEVPLEVVLTDFGIARAHQQFTHVTSTVKGTFHYAAPEVHAGESSAKSDWFSLGAMVYELHSGRKLFSMDDGTDVSESDARSRSIQGNYPTDRIEDARWRLLVDGLLTWDKDDRWGADQVEAWLRGESPEVIRGRQGPAQHSPNVSYSVPWSGRLVSTLPALADELRRGGQHAEEFLGGSPDDRLLVFIGSFPGTEPALSVLRGGASGSTKSFQLQGILDPDSSPEFRGHPFDTSSLGDRITAAGQGDETSRDWLYAVQAQHVLRTFGELRHSPVAIEADSWLADWARQASETIESLPRELRDEASTAYRAALPRLFVEAMTTGPERQRRRRAEVQDWIGQQLAGDGSWQVVGVDESRNRALVLRSEVLGLMPFAAQGKGVRWEESPIRAFLNRSVFPALPAAVRSLAGGDIHPINAATDRMFLLSADEVKEHVVEVHDRRATFCGAPTRWWLRSQVNGGRASLAVGEGGEVSADGVSCDAALGVRPAMWIDMAPQAGNAAGPAKYPAGSYRVGIDAKQKAANYAGPSEWASSLAQRVLNAADSDLGVAVIASVVFDMLAIAERRPDAPSPRRARR